MVRQNNWRPFEGIRSIVAGGVQRWRLIQSLNTIAKARDKCIKLNLSLKMISPKLICPILENCSLEDDEFMQDKWANLIVNMLDSDKNLQNHIFPFLLSQLSKQEFQQLKINYDAVRDNVFEIEKKIEKNREEFKATVSDISKLLELSSEYGNLFGDRENLLNLSILNVEPFEISNLIRLGLIRTIPKSKALAQPLTFNGTVDIQVEHGGFIYYLSDLGVLFLRACDEPENAP